MYNMSVVNPAYATENTDILTLGGLYRAQWVGIEGAPTTVTFFAHKPLSKRVEMGISIVHDEQAWNEKISNARMWSEKHDLFWTINELNAAIHAL